jgi:hypothetical protein
MKRTSNLPRQYCQGRLEVSWTKHSHTVFIKAIKLSSDRVSTDSLPVRYSCSGWTTLKAAKLQYQEYHAVLVVYVFDVSADSSTVVTSNHPSTRSTTYLLIVFMPSQSEEALSLPIRRFSLPSSLTTPNVSHL